MLFQRLLETNARASVVQSIEGYALSIVTHAAIIGGALAATTSGGSSEENADSFSPVAYFIPKDKMAGMRPKQERISYMSTASVAVEAEGSPPESKAAPAPPPPTSEPGLGLEEMSSVAADDSEDSGAEEGDSVMTVLQVDSAAARYDDSAAPPYPPAMLERRIEGSVAIQYVVDTTGRADTTSVVILSATHADFATSVRNTLPAMQFRPAVMRDRRVRQLVQQLFSFRIDTAMIAQQEAERQRAAAPVRKPDLP